jgi:hypothetical protein
VQYGPLTVSSTHVTLTQQAPTGLFTVQQTYICYAPDRGSYTCPGSGPGPAPDHGSGQITMTWSCNGDIASFNVSPPNVPINEPQPHQIHVTADGHGNSGGNGNCAIRVSGGGGMATTVNVTVSLNGHGNSAVPGAAPGRPGPGIPH